MDLFNLIKRKRDVWVRVDDWQSNTLVGLHVLDLGIYALPKPRHTPLVLEGRNGYMMDRKKGFDGYERKLVFFVEEEKVLIKLYKKLGYGKSYHFVFSTDIAYQERGEVLSIEIEKLKRGHSRVTFLLLMQPFKESRVKTHTTLKINQSQLLYNPGSATVYPSFYISGKGECRIVVNDQRLLLNLGNTKTTLWVDCEKMDLKSPEGELQNNKLLQNTDNGFFCALLPGENRVTIEGENLESASFSLRWRYVC